MKLLYLYIEDYRCIKNQELNFDSNFHFHLHKDNTGQWELIEDKVENPLPADFWGSTKGKHNVVESVSVIVGKNGSGKTTLAKIMGDVIGYRDTECEYLVVFQNGKGADIQYTTNHKSGVVLSKNIKK